MRLFYVPCQKVTCVTIMILRQYTVEIRDKGRTHKRCSLNII